MRVVFLSPCVAVAVALSGVPAPAAAQSGAGRPTVEVVAPPLTPEHCARLKEKPRKSCEDRLREQRKQQLRAATKDVARQMTPAQRQLQQAAAPAAQIRKDAK